MFTPKYLIRLDKRTFFPDEVVCLGSQLKVIVNSLNELIESHVWFCADVDAFSPIPKNLGIDSFMLKKVESSYSLINLCENVNQFLSGVFIAVREINTNLTYPDLLIGTEDKQFRCLDLDGVLIEIRAFDTFWFELYSEDQDLMMKLSLKFNVKIE